MKLSLIVAVAENGVIGSDDDLPWRLSADLKRFKQLTMGHAILMGRKTYDSIGRPLPGRRSVVISRNPNLSIQGCEVVSTFAAATQLVAADDEAFVIGGRQIYEMALPQVDRIYWTRVRAQVVGDVFFPEVDWSQWKMIEEVHGHTSDRNDHDYSFQTFDRARVANCTLSDDLDLRR
ncbi:MAG: dihydrofolate reductase [Planctomycetaceae bacterium]|nr:dihydrofolate reductase [Planctomycetaceae bacterium]